MIDETAPNPERAALLTIDMQNDFALVGAPAFIPGTLDVATAIGRLAEGFRSRGRPIVHVLRLYEPDGSDAERVRRTLIREAGPIVAPGTNGAELVDALKPDPAVRVDAETLRAGKLQEVGPAEWLMYKPRWGAFYGTPLQDHLEDWGVDTLIICGCNFPNCPRTTVYEASERDFRVALVRDATSGVYVRGMTELEGIGVSVQTVEEICASFWSSTQTPPTATRA